LVQLALDSGDVVSPVSFQSSLFAGSEASFDHTFSTLMRIGLSDSAWIDVAYGWVRGADLLFEQVLKAKSWGQRTRWMYEHRLLEPRLTAHWSVHSGEALEPPILECMRRSLSEQYEVTFDSLGFNLYRDGRDSVAWHRDKIRKDIPLPVVALVSLGEPRKLMFRPLGGGRSRAFAVGRGDLLVTGGSTQRTWEHAVLKVARAGARISIAFRYGLDSRAYGRTHT
jgi:alkylated DNA repair dioxygenase AlkB